MTKGGGACLPFGKRLEERQVLDELFQISQHLHGTNSKKEKEAHDSSKKSNNQTPKVEQHVSNSQVVPVHIARLRRPLREPLGVVSALLRLCTHCCPPPRVEGDEPRSHYVLLLGQNPLPLFLNLPSPSHANENKGYELKRINSSKMKDIYYRRFILIPMNDMSKTGTG